MNKTMKATMWSLGVFMTIGFGVYFAGCTEDDPMVDGGDPGCVKAGDACDGGKCFAVTGGKFECFLECTVAGDPCDTGTCYWMGPAAGAFFCGPTGIKAVGEVCGTSTDCIEGAQCLDQEGIMNCYQICTDTCDTGTCEDSGQGFKVCLEVAA